MAAEESTRAISSMASTDRKIPNRAAVLLRNFDAHEPELEELGMSSGRNWAASSISIHMQF